MSLIGVTLSIVLFMTGYETTGGNPNNMRQHPATSCFQPLQKDPLKQTHVWLVFNSSSHNPASINAMYSFLHNSLTSYRSESKFRQEEKEAQLRRRVVEYRNAPSIDHSHVVAYF